MGLAGYLPPFSVVQDNGDEEGDGEVKGEDDARKGEVA
jgi:hypothetical protein